MSIFSDKKTTIPSVIENRLYNLYLFLALLACGIFLLVGIALRWPISSLFYVATSFVLHLFFFVASLRLDDTGKLRLRWITIIIPSFSIFAGWFFNGGISGHFPTLYGIMMVLYLSFMPAKSVIRVSMMIFLIFIASVSLEYAFPHWVSHPPHASYSIGVATGVSIILIVLPIYFFKIQIEKYTRQLQRQHKLLEQSNQMKEQFINTLSHEIRTPMNGIMMSLNYLQKAEFPNEHKQMLQNTQINTDRLWRILEKMLSFSEILSDNSGIYPQKAMLKPFLDQLVAPIQKAATEKGLQFEANLVPALDQFLFFDQKKIRYILQSLHDNALKFTMRGGRIEFKTEILQDHSQFLRVGFNIIDTGIGFPKHLEPLLKMNKYSNMTSTAGGLGLGLTIAQRLLRIMGSSLRLIPSEKGTHFRFDLQFRKTARAGSSFSTTPMMRKNVLVVDDDLVNQKVMQKLLRSLNIKHTIAKDGMQAVEKIQEEHYSIIFMDLQMPEMDGFETTQAIFKHYQKQSKVPPTVIALTANNTDSDRKKCFQVGMKTYMNKPIKLPDLQNVLHHWNA